jgi:predicted DNA-binding transcriptional regulator YafY
MKQYQRHNQILRRLAQGETLSITALANEWQIATKTVQRDFAKLMEGDYGVVRAEDGKRFVMDQGRRVSEKVQTAIHLLDSLSAQVGGDFYVQAQSVLQRLYRYIDSPFYAHLDMESTTGHLKLIHDLELAIAEHRMITLSYKKWYKPEEIKTYREVKPYKIIIFDGFWYLLTQYKEHFIKFYLKEIHNLEVHERQFDPDPHLLERMNHAVGIWFDPKVKPFEVTLLLERSAITYFKRKPIRGQYLKENPDGTAELSFAITDKRELFDIMKKWLPQIRVIEPQGIQEEFEGMLRRYLGQS